MVASSYVRGHEVRYNSENKKWYWSDTKKECKDERACKKCKCYPTEEGYDACLGYVEGYISVCCGHGVEKPLYFNKIVDK